jgi:hypothetical protein
VDRVFLSERLEPVVEVKVRHAHVSPGVGVLDPVPRHAEQQLVIGILCCELEEVG